MSDGQALTESLCPHCLRRVAAGRVVEGDSVFLEKSCPIHGRLDKTLIWKNSPRSYSEWNRGEGCRREQLQESSPASDPGCPFNCGICPDHLQGTCTAIIEVTHRCNLRCPVCFAGSKDTFHTDPGLDQISRMLGLVLDRGGPCPLQLSGGEPTLRDDLPEIVALARDMGFDHVQVNTNGIRLAQDADYGRALMDAGTTVCFLQFDGLTEETYIRIRGTELFQLKQRALQRCSELKLGVILVPTLVKGVNDVQIGSIIRHAKQWVPTVKGVHFQPMTYLGRYPSAPGNKDRILIPDILLAIEEQTGGELKVDNFMPPGCEESHCSFSALTILAADGSLIPTTRFENATQPGNCCSGDPAEQSRDFVRSRWRYRESNLTAIGSGSGPGSVRGDEASSGDLFERALSHTLCISGMAFQDAWNIDLQRLRRCCVHVVTPEETLVPFCAYYLTGSNGQRLPRASRRIS